MQHTSYATDWSGLHTGKGSNRSGLIAPNEFERARHRYETRIKAEARTKAKKAQSGSASQEAR